MPVLQGGCACNGMPMIIFALRMVEKRDTGIGSLGLCRTAVKTKHTSFNVRNSSTCDRRSRPVTGWPSILHTLTLVVALEMPKGVIDDANNYPILSCLLRGNDGRETALTPTTARRS